MIRRILALLMLAALFLPVLSFAETGGILTFTLQVPYEEDNESFSFELQLADSGISGRYGDLNFDEGVASFSLRKGGVVRVSGLPAGLSYVLKSFNDDNEYLEQFYNSDGHAVSTPAGKVPVSADGGISVAEVNLKDSAYLTLRLNVTDLVTDPDSTVLAGTSASAAGKKLPLSMISGRVLAGPINFDPTVFSDYDKAGTHTYTYALKTDDGQTVDNLKIRAAVTLKKGESISPEDDYYSAVFSLYEGDELVGRESWEGTGRLEVAFGDENALLAGGTDLRIKGSLLLVGRKLEPGEFTYALTEEDGNVIATAENTEDGDLIFTPISYSPADAGVHIYTLSRTGETDGSVTYDDREYTVGVVVTCRKGEVRATVGSITVDGEKTNAIHFENKFALTDFKVYNLWQGGNEGNIELVLYANGEKMHPQPDCYIDGATYIFADLPMFDSRGNRIVYSARELYVDEYMAMYVNTGDFSARTHMLYNGGTVINRKVTQFAFRVRYYGLDGRPKPDLQFILYNNGSVYYKKTQPETDEYGRYAYKHLPVKSAGDLADYSAEAVPMEGYIITYENRGDYAGITDCIRDDGTVIVRRVPQTGENPDFALPVFICCAAGFLGTLVLLKRKPKDSGNSRKG